MNKVKKVKSSLSTP